MIKNIVFDFGGVIADISREQAVKAFIRLGVKDADRILDKYHQTGIFQELFHSPPGVLFTFPSRYWYAIGQTGMLRLTQRSGLIHAGFHEARATWDNTIGRRLTSRYGAGTLYGQAFKPVPLASRFMTPARPVGTGTRDPTTPATQPPTGITRNRFGLIRFRSPLLTEYPFLQVLRCFTSLRTPRP